MAHRERMPFGLGGPVEAIGGDGPTERIAGLNEPDDDAVTVDDGGNGVGDTTHHLLGRRQLGERGRQCEQRLGGRGLLPSLEDGALGVECRGSQAGVGLEDRPFGGLERHALGANGHEGAVALLVGRHRGQVDVAWRSGSAVRRLVGLGVEDTVDEFVGGPDALGFVDPDGAEHARSWKHRRRCRGCTAGPGRRSPLPPPPGSARSAGHPRRRGRPRYAGVRAGGIRTTAFVSRRARPEPPHRRSGTSARAPGSSPRPRTDTIR